MATFGRQASISAMPAVILMPQRPYTVSVYQPGDIPSVPSGPEISPPGRQEPGIDPRGPHVPGPEVLPPGIDPAPGPEYSPPPGHAPGMADIIAFAFAFGMCCVC
eukprot:jgi/Chrzof1/10574/Cz05g04010.t1